MIVQPCLVSHWVQSLLVLLQDEEEGFNTSDEEFERQLEEASLLSEVAKAEGGSARKRKGKGKGRKKKTRTTNKYPDDPDADGYEVMIASSLHIHFHMNMSFFSQIQAQTLTGSIVPHAVIRGCHNGCVLVDHD